MARKYSNEYIAGLAGQSRAMDRDFGFDDSPQDSYVFRVMQNLAIGLENKLSGKINKRILGDEEDE